MFTAVKVFVSDKANVWYNSFKPIEAKSAQEAGLSPKNILLTALQDWYLLNNFINIIVKINGAVTIAVVEIIEPIIPAVVYPVYVAIFIPIGPGVILDTAIIFVSSFMLNQLYLLCR